MTETKVPETINLVILQADKDGQLACFNHPIVRQFSSEYLSIVARALAEISKGMEAEAKAKSIEETKAARKALS